MLLWLVSIALIIFETMVVWCKVCIGPDIKLHWAQKVTYAVLLTVGYCLSLVVFVPWIVLGIAVGNRSS